MTSKENTVKIRANKDIEGVITEGKVYEAIEFRDGYVFKNDVGKHDYAHKSHFTDATIADGIFRVIVNADKFCVGDMPDWVTTTPKTHDKPAIEVGSEWLWEEANETLVVKCVGYTSVFYQWISDGSEGCGEIDDFLKSFKPKPKTVTMYFYQATDQYIAHSEELPYCKSLFTHEIELP